MFYEVRIRNAGRIYFLIIKEKEIMKRSTKLNCLSIGLVFFTLFGKYGFAAETETIGVSQTRIWRHPIACATTLIGGQETSTELVLQFGSGDARHRDSGSWLMPDGIRKIDWWSKTDKDLTDLTFSADSGFVAVHYRVPGGGHLVDWLSLDAGDLAFSWLWQSSPGGGALNLRSVAYDSANGVVVGLADFKTAPGVFQSIAVALDASKGFSQSAYFVHSPRDQDFQTAPLFAALQGAYGLHTKLSEELPLFVKTGLREVTTQEDTRDQFFAQLVHWQNQASMNLPAALNYLDVIEKPLSDQGYLAILLGDKTTVEVVSLPELEEGLQQANSLDQRIPEVGQGWRKSARHLTHRDSVVKAIWAEWSPHLVTETGDGLHIWDVLTGQQVGSINRRMDYFRLLERMSLLVSSEYGKLALYSLPDGRRIGSYPGFDFDSLFVREFKRAGETTAYIAKYDNSVWQITESPALQPSLREYKVSETGIKIKSVKSQSLHTVIEVAEKRYFAHIYKIAPEQHGDLPYQGNFLTLVVEFYSLDGTGKRVMSVNVPTEANQSDFVFALDPAGKRVVFSTDKATVKVLSLQTLVNTFTFLD